MTSPSALVAIAHHVGRLMLFLMNWTWPSAIVTLTPPGWALEEGTVQLESVLQPTPQAWS